MEEPAFNPQKTADELMLKKLSAPLYLSASEMNAILARIAQLKANAMSGVAGIRDVFCTAVDEAIKVWLTHGKIDVVYGKEVEREVNGAELKCINRRNAEKDAEKFVAPTDDELRREATKRIGGGYPDLPPLDMDGRDGAGRRL